MNEQTNPIPEPTTTADTPIIEPPQAEPAQAPTEPISAPLETAQTEPLSEPIETPPETGTAQMGRNEPFSTTRAHAHRRSRQRERSERAVRRRAGVGAMVKATTGHG